jgi:hypothetical protein
MQFFVLVNPKSDQSTSITDFIVADGALLGNAPKCSTCNQFIGMRQLLPPMRFELELMGRSFGDLAFGSGNDVLVSGRFRDAFAGSGLTGLSGFAPAEIIKVVSHHQKISGPLPNYFVAAPGRSGAAVDSRASGMEYNKPWTCEACRVGAFMRLRRLVLESGTWTGEDVFIPRGLPGIIVASERFKRFCDRHVFSNCVLIDAADYHFDFYPGLTPGGLAALPTTRR